MDELLTDADISDTEAPHILLVTLWAAMVSPLPPQLRQGVYGRIPLQAHALAGLLQ